VAAGRGWDVLVIGGAARVGVLAVGTAGTTTVQLDAVTGAGDAVAFTGAVTDGRSWGAVSAEGAGGVAVGAAGKAGANGRWWRAGELVVVLVDGGSAEAGSELLNSWCTVVGFQDVLGGVWCNWLG